jgi:hypothetical protein
MGTLNLLQNIYILYFIFPIACAFVCWVFISVLVYCFFSPQQPVNFAGFKLQGYLPAKQNFILQAVFEKAELLILQQKEEMKQHITSQQSVEKIMPELEKHIDEFLTVKLPKDIPMLSMFIGEKTIYQIKEVFMKELRVLFPHILSTYLDEMLKAGSVRKMLTDKLSPSSASGAIIAFRNKNNFSIIRLKLFACIFGLIVGCLISSVIFLFT